jgi:hypothetical protein
VSGIRERAGKPEPSPEQGRICKKDGAIIGTRKPEQDKKQQAFSGARVLAIRKYKRKKLLEKERQVTRGI